MGIYRGRRYYIVSTKTYLKKEYKKELKEGTHKIVRLPSNNPDVRMGKGRYALIRKRR